ncbi:MAG: carbon-nitrogen hydrolase family protein [Thaumarchaeota archaeon]|nr:carbon-nitrogen hydrolase family protein [Nitrososphaerota archaeon]
MLRIAIAQISAGADPGRNADRVEEIIRGARGADLVIFPEYSLGARIEDSDRLAEPLDGPLIGRLASAAAEAGTLVIMGILERAEGGPFNSIVALGEGDAIVVHRKAILFDALGSAESRYVRPGDMPLTLMEIGEFTAGFATCFELRFPEIFRSLAAAGADLFIVPSAWYAGPLKEEQWVISAAARAMENTSYLAAADMYGHAFIGRSLIVDPWGHVELDLGSGERVAQWALDRGAVDEARSRLPLLEMSRRLRSRELPVRRIRAPG